jgi:hypothetical protein
MKSTTVNVPIPRAAKQLDMTSPGLLKLLRRTNRAIRDDGHWFMTPEDLAQIKRARLTLSKR